MQMSMRRRLSAAALAASRAMEMPAQLFLYLSAGLLRVSDVQRMSAGIWRTFATQGEDIACGLAAWEKEIYGRVVRAGDRICVVGCGTGRDVLPFRAAGHEVVGVEPSPEPVATLRRILLERGRTADVIEGFIEDVALPGAFDCVIFSVYCYSYIPESARRIAMLQRVSGHVKPGGRLVINYVRRFRDWNGRGVKVAAFVARIVGTGWQWEPHDVVQRVADGDRGAILYAHHFMPDELEREVEHAGFRVEEHVLNDDSGPVAVLVRRTS